MAASPGHGRRGESLATYQRRRVAAAAVLVVVLVVIGIGLFDGGGEEAPQSANEVIARQREEQPVRLTVSVSGDLLIHSPVYDRALALGNGRDYDFTPLFEEIRPYVKEADLAICHVEVPMTPAAPASFPIFNTPPELAEAIAKTGWEACDTASNHSLDQGQEGIDQTLKALDRAGVEHTGSYASKGESGKILMLGVKGVRLAYLAYTTDTNGIPLPRPWSLSLVEKPEAVIADARRARKQGAEAVLVNIHWGIDMSPEYVTEESSKQAAFVKRLVAAPEITAVVGQGPHVVQPIDRVKGKLVVYSEGNLISNQGADAGLAAESQDGLIALLDLVVDGGGPRVEGVRYVPTWVQHPDYTVLPVGSALQGGGADAASLRASYERTVGIAGEGRDIEPDPPKLPGAGR
jgi:poly-gamma-glutamate synthesis protein (capsule biosynthesis protein)